VRKNKAEICVPRFTDIINSILGGHRSFTNWQKDDSRPF